MVVVCIFAPPTSAQNPDAQRGTAPAAQQPVPNWVSRGIPGAGHAALAPLVGSWRVDLSIHGTVGRSPDLPPIVSKDIRTTRVWTADGQYIEDTTEGTVEGQPYWRRGWLGYSNIDRRYEWVTIAPRVPMMIYLGKPGSGEQMPIEVTGVFTDQGVVSEQTVGKHVVQRTVFRIESNDRHISELYFTPSEGKEQLALRLVYTRIKSESDQRVTRPRGIVLPKLPELAPGETGPYCLIAKHRAKPGKADAYERRMLADLEKTRAEPGALQFHIHRDRSDPDLFVIYEVWRDIQALHEHFEKPYVKQFVVDSAEYIEGDMEAQWIVMSSQYVTGRPREKQK
jgi:quinol monooxygenase YgiN